MKIRITLDIDRSTTYDNVISFCDAVGSNERLYQDVYDLEVVMVAHNRDLPILLVALSTWFPHLTLSVACKTEREAMWVMTKMEEYDVDAVVYAREGLL